MLIRYSVLESFDGCKEKKNEIIIIDDDYL